MRTLDRRSFIQRSAGTLGGIAVAPTLLAPTPSGTGPTVGGPDAAPTAEPGLPGFYRFHLGDMEVTVLSDGSFRLPTELFAFDVDAGTREPYLQERLVPLDEHPLGSNPVVIDTGAARVLVDAGSGISDVSDDPVARHRGRLLPMLAAAGIPSDSIDTIILTHAHPDHLGGLVDRGTGDVVFPEAEIVVSEVELDHWSDEDLASRSAEWTAPIVPGVQEVLGSVDDRLRTVRDGDEVVAGIRTVASPGHTPGHIAPILEAGGQQVLFLGDAVVTTHMSFEHPEWQFLFDLDPEEAGRTRRQLLDRAATDRILLLGYHFPFPGVGYALRYRDGFRWHPAGWRVMP